ncbi:hypothetical protein HMF8227_01482 [Saliniradius amylolyticus]|uniref:Urease accessory protein UreH-like transmembrane domain-containing protein n=1 Tax=Saliniradius amylolyticus TaxID=2183582 RepID=A0A2S2E4N2_9ALTE|nr:sulfite exporter TauE/SafE family protein [Saliniradius amylolyticus]AWL11957.1 hypothetical protein HMF8227_01482 [Saliniradius amylolyticus]
MAPEISLLSALLIGLAGGIHCIGMCGGVVGALSYAIPRGRSHWPYVLGYNVGRIASYTLAGTLAGALGSTAGAHLPLGPYILNTISGLLLLAMGLYLGNWWRGLTYLERLGGRVWRHIAPLSKSLLPFRSPLAALPYGLVWGWLPCGLVYSTLSWSVASGSAIQGAQIMLLFGLGTLPTLIALGTLGQQLRQWLGFRWVRSTLALILVIFSLWVLLKPWLDSI